MIVVEEGWPTCSIASELAMVAMEQGFDDLDAPVLRVTDEDVLLPYAANLEKAALVDVPRVIAAGEDGLQSRLTSEPARTPLVLSLSKHRSSFATTKRRAALRQAQASGSIWRQFVLSRDRMTTETSPILYGYPDIRDPRVMVAVPRARREAVLGACRAAHQIACRHARADDRPDQARLVARHGGAAASDPAALPKGEPLLAELQQRWAGRGGLDALVDAAEAVLLAEDAAARTAAGAAFREALFALSGGAGGARWGAGLAGRAAGNGGRRGAVASDACTGRTAARIARQQGALDARSLVGGHRGARRRNDAGAAKACCAWIGLTGLNGKVLWRGWKCRPRASILAQTR